MVTLFNTVVYMSMVSTLAAVLIISIRALIGSRLPKVLSYSMWGILLFRLLIPISFPSSMSVFNLYPVHSNNIASPLTAIMQSDTQPVIQKSLEIHQIETMTHRISQEIIAIIWLVIAIVLAAICMMLYKGTTNKLKEAILYKPSILLEEVLGEIRCKRKVEIYSLEELPTPLVCGVLKPKIIVPTKLVEAIEPTILKNVIRHELIHIKRFDHLIKLVSIAVTCIHWFNPIIWIALVLAQKDMERACDEKVVQLSKRDIKKEYANALLSFSLEKSNLKSIGTVAFGESNIKKRIKGILSYKKPKFLIKVICILILIGVGVLLISDASHKTIEINLELVKEQRGESWTELDKISPYVISAAIASEDRNFNKHHGVDFTRIGKAIISNMTTQGRLQGGSTITQQLVKNVIITYDKPRSLSRKREEIYTAIRLEKNYPKDQIMEAYLNVVSFGHGTMGIGDAARFYFEKEASDLSLEQAASLIATIQNPSQYSLLNQKERNKERTDYIIDIMNE